MVKIQVLGKGMIPRGHGLAPMLKPFAADMKLIQLILDTPGLKPYLVHPVTNTKIQITRDNLRRLWNSFNNFQPPVKKEEKKEVKPQPSPVITSIPVPKKEEVPTPPVSVIKEETVETKEEKVENNNNNNHKDKKKFKPINNDKN